ncbi:MAG: tetratricopeptide repeat protein [Cytophagaceae bacterium]|nr:tetratricopeptide repeat protein [Cytophagaceae bacterium]
MERYNAEQLYSIANQEVQIYIEEEVDPIEGIVCEIQKDPAGDYITFHGAEEEKILITSIDQIDLLIEGQLPVYYMPLDEYDTDNFAYPSEFIDGFSQYIGMSVNFYGNFDGFYELRGTLSEVNAAETKLVVDNYEVELWRLNVAFLVDENYQKHYVSPENLSDAFPEPLDNLYGEEDFEMLIGKKIRIKTMDPEIQDEEVTVSGYCLAEGYSGGEVYHLELEEFPDHILEPSEIQFIYLIGEDGSETLVEPSGGNLYSDGEEPEEEAVSSDSELEAQFYSDFKNNILPELRPYRREDGKNYLMWLKFTDEEFQKVTEAIADWYTLGTPADFKNSINKNTMVMDSRNYPGWYNEVAPSAAGYNARPYKNLPVIIIQDKRAKDYSEAPNDFIFYTISDIDKLTDDLGLFFKNYFLAIGRMYESYAGDQEDATDYLKASIKNIKEHLKIYPSHVVALNSVGYNLYQFGKYEEALEYFDKGLAIYPQWITLLANKMDACIYLNKFDEALKVAAYTASLEPEQGEWQWYFAKIYEAMGEKEKAKQFATRALDKGFSLAGELLERL